MVDDDPAQYATSVDLASCHDRLGWTLFGLGRKEQALEEFEAARAILQRLLDKYPRNVLRRGRDTLANVLINMAEAQRRWDAWSRRERPAIRPSRSGSW